MALPTPPPSSHNSDTKPKRRHSSSAPLLFVVLLFFASFSFFHSVQVLSTDHDHIVKASLEDFKKGKDGIRIAPPADAEGGEKATSKTNTKKTIPLDTRNEGTKQDIDKTGNTDDVFLVDEDEDPIDNPAPADGNSTFSACLLVMDDNHRLVEWVAYHYHVLPLRYLIIAVDPRSRTSPTRILNKWRRMGVYVEEWDDFKFLKEGIAKNVVPDDAELQIKRDRHRIRQKNFYRECLIGLKKANRTFTTLIDTDEFLTYNHMGGKYFEEWEKLQQKIHEESRFADKKRIQPSKPPPTTAKEGGLIKYIRQEQEAGTWQFFQRPCISSPRLQFGAKESRTEDQAKKLPRDSGLKIDRLDTLRYRKHAYRQDFVKNGLSKSIIDVSRVEQFPRIQSLHRPIKTICTAPWKDEWDSGLRINHYLGSWEGECLICPCFALTRVLFSVYLLIILFAAYSFRDDSRRGGERSFEGWAFKAQDADDTDDNIRPWINGFFETHGKKKAKELLKGAGLPRGFQGTGKNWTIMFLDEILGMNETTGNDMRIQFDNFVRDFHKNNQNTEGLV